MGSRLARGHVTAGPSLVEQEPGRRVVRLESSDERLLYGRLIPGGTACPSRCAIGRGTSQFQRDIGGSVERVE